MPLTIQIDKEKDKFYLAVCKHTTSVHSLMTVGYQKPNGESFAISAYGKGKTNNSSCCGQLFWETEAATRNEYGPSHSSTVVLSYKAFEITYEQYIKYLHYLKILSDAQLKKRTLNYPLEAYVPIKEEGNLVTLQEMPLTAQNLPTHSGSIPKFNPKDMCISTGNNCRHTGINLVEKGTQLSNLGAGVSSNYMRALPLKMTINRGKIVTDKFKPFFILPLPPAAYPKLTAFTRKKMEALYTRLDEIIQIAQKNELTAQKFDGIKDLYAGIAAKEECDDLWVFNEIRAWAESNQILIGSHRKSHWFSFQTATLKLFNSLSKEEPKQAPLNP